MKLLVTLLLLYSTGQAQTSYKSLASQYKFNVERSYSFEWIERDIIIDSTIITIKSYGKEFTDIQIWRIQSKEENYDPQSANTVYYTELASGENYEYPALFHLQFNSEGKLESIICEIPSEAYDRLPNDAPIKTMFLID